MTQGLLQVITSLKGLVTERKAGVVRSLVAVDRRILPLVLGHDDCGNVNVYYMNMGKYNATTTTCSIIFEGSEDIRVDGGRGGARGAG